MNGLGREDQRVTVGDRSGEEHRHPRLGRGGGANAGEGGMRDVWEMQGRARSMVTRDRLEVARKEAKANAAGNSY